MPDDMFVSQDRFRNGGDLLEVGIGRVDDRELDVSYVFGIIFGFAVGEAHVAFDREQIREQTAGEHDDETGVGQMNAEFAPGSAKAFRMRRDQVN